MYSVEVVYNLSILGPFFNFLEKYNLLAEGQNENVSRASIKRQSILENRITAGRHYLTTLWPDRLHSHLISNQQ